MKSKSQRYNSAISLQDVLKLILDENNLTKGLNKIKIKEIWADQMGNGVNRYTEKISLSGQTLTIELTSSVLREELSYSKEKIIQMLNESLGAELISTIKFK